MSNSVETSARVAVARAQQQLGAREAAQPFLAEAAREHRGERQGAETLAYAVIRIVDRDLARRAACAQLRERQSADFPTLAQEAQSLALASRLRVCGLQHLRKQARERESNSEKRARAERVHRARQRTRVR